MDLGAAYCGSRTQKNYFSDTLFVCPACPRPASPRPASPWAKPPEQLQDSGKGDCSGCACGFRLRTNAENSVMTSPIGKG